MESKGYRVMAVAPVPFFEDRGTPIRLYEIVRSLQRLGTTTDIYTYHLGRDVPGMNIVRMPNIPWYKRTSAGANYHKLYLDLILSMKALPAHIGSNYDVIHAWLHEGVVISMPMRILKRRPIVFDAQGSLTGEMTAHGFVTSGSFKMRLWKRMEGFIDKRTDAIISSSTENAKKIQKMFGVEKEKIHVVCDGVDIERFKPARPKPELFRTIGLPRDKKIVVYTGILHTHQGIDIMLEALQKICEETKDVHFLVVGFPNVEHYRSMARRLDIGGSVTFTGKVDYKTIQDYLNLGDMAISAKILKSGEGNEKIYTYMASGLPTVVFDYHVNREALGNLGIYAKPENPHSLAKAILDNIFDGKKCTKISEQLRKKAIKDHSWDRVANKVTEVYRTVSE